MATSFIKKTTNRDVLVDDTDNPLPVTLAGAGSSTVSTNIAQYGGTNVSSSNPFNVTGATQELVTSSDWTATGTVANGSLTATLKAAPGASLYATITDLTISTDTLGAAATLSIKDGAGGTVKWQARLGTTALATVKITFATPISASANTLLQIATTDPTSGNIYYAAGGSVVG